MTDESVVTVESRDISALPLSVRVLHVIRFKVISFHLFHHIYYPTMPIHFKVASHDHPEPLDFECVSHLQITKPEDLLTNARTTRCAELLQSSFVKEVDLSNVFGTTNGFVDAVTSAYNRHHHLIFKFVDLLRTMSMDLY